MTGVALEFRRGPGRLLALCLVALGVFFVWQSLHPGPAVWPLVVSGVGISASILGPLAGGVAALAGIRNHRRGTDSLELLAVRGPAASGAAQLAALLAWVSIAYVIVIAIVYTRAALTATWAGPGGIRTLSIGLGLLVHVVVGFVLGRAVPSRLTPPLTVVALYGISVVNTVASSGYLWSPFLPIDIHSVDEFSRLKPAFSPGQALWSIGVAIVITSAWVLVRGRPRRRATGSLFVGVGFGAAGALLLLPLDGVPFESGNVFAWTCQGADPQICIHSALESARPAITTEIVPVTRRLSGTPFVIHRAEQRERGPEYTAPAGATAYALDDLSPESLQLLGQELAVNALGNDGCFRLLASSANAVPSAYDLNQIVAASVGGTPGAFTPVDPAATKAQEWFAGISAQQRKVWLSAHEKAIRDCSLSYSAFR